MSIKHILLATVCAVAIPAMASAADLPLRSAPPAFVPPPPPIFTWTGFYLGVNAGYDFDHDSRFRQAGGLAVNTGVTTGSRPGSVTSSDDGFTGGGQIGYNYQFGSYGLGAASFVIGLEADAAYTDLDKRVATSNFDPTTGSTYLNTFHSSLDYLGTVRGRVGVAFDRVLVYGTGGLAYGNLETGVNLYSPGSTTAVRFHGGQNGIETGYAVGGGIEYAIPTDSYLNRLNFFHSSAVTVKAEYLYYDLGSRNLGDYPVAGNGGTGYYVSHVHTDGNLIRVGLNYKF